MEKVKEMRLKRGLTQRELAKKANVSVTMINLIENGKVNTSVEVLEKIANALKCKVTALF